MKFQNSTRKATRLLRLVAVTAALALGATACAGGGSGGGGGEAGGTTEVNYQLGWLKLTQFGGFFAGDREGFYEEEGISPEFTAGGSNILSWQQVVTGKALLGDEDNTNALVAIEDGQPLVIIGTVFQTSPFSIISLADDPIESIDDFEGRTIAVSDASLAQFQALVAAAGIPEDSVTFVSAGTDPSQLTTGQVSGYAGYATSQGASLELQGAEIHTLLLEDLGVPSYGNVIVTTQENLEKNRETIVGFMRASVKGFEYMNANPEDIAAYVVNEVNPAGGLDLETEEQTAKIQRELIEQPDGVLRVDPEKMQAIIDALVEAGTLEESIDATTIVDTSVLDEVYGDKTSLLE
ncbi:ABC transporter substrate-binding protein [Leucobacter sp. CSA1]|uniref:Thiamine pyrimidine synthase n=1 Tax=Leucobacter chromiisoli TaxID=2796471 RepID=A0A934UUK3_9MICO|nr:ABC transporter substrate-binding protein [Leucobacter chromiisoli]MBK0418910.1 ABC transporter substrate-binding protein [Leucobacter chromiisoli]